MSKNIKAISRPKVRFSQFSDNVQNKEKDVEYCKKKTVLQTNGPKIKNIVTLKKPVKIVDPKELTTVCNKNVLQHDYKTKISTHNDITSENFQSTCLSNKNVSKIEVSSVLHNANGIQNIKENCNTLTLDKSLQDNILKDCKERMQQKGKENRDAILKKGFNKDLSKSRKGSSQYTESVTKTRNYKPLASKNMQKINTKDSKNLKMTKSAPSIIKKIRNQTMEGTINAKSLTSNVMPCYKIVAKNKVSPVKKTILRNTSGSKIETSVRPGIFHKKKSDAKASDANKKHNVTLDVAAEELAQPGYNSIACTINKLKELKQQKIVTDIDHLSFAQKSFINGKISTALDFPLDEVIYKNLVDLNIDEKQLPSTITRSKDPEPRQKDIIPKLSNFFVPENIKEICEAVHVKPRTPKIDENWNAFKISDKILEWKHSMDDI
ncbi:uncharacterized protein LOC126856103 [Cataglyphis hispanica]|uniref:uncharacterized protein LOC126856103 n=1 Tax=Cataglyphis hispanica TaxID=1086592 RepID=UPI00217F458B|nr:uncharacterized protein LOC126856103 [Cataglyphis hispanica]